ncbi:MAG: hypothetical protein L6Q33_09510, partial [Bacteriovoracaceae bacterium]|nr:hypothetical protein [Bacteriovoracaceae bacterium]
MNTILGILVTFLLLLSFMNPSNAKTHFDNESDLVTKGPFYRGEYRLGLYQDSILDLEKRTHIVVIGSGVKEDSDQFFQSGVARAYRLKEVYPTDQVIIMGSPEVIDRGDEVVFSDFNVNVFKTENNSLTGDRFLNELLPFKKIASINFYGHSSPWSIKLGKSDAAFDPSAHKNKLQTLKSQFLPD